MDDSRIKGLFLERSEAAVEELSAKYGAACLRLAQNVLGNKEDAEECVNDALLKVWNSVPPNDPASLGAYVLRIVRNLALNRLSYNSAEKRGAAALCIDELAECIPSRNGVERTLEDAELTRLLDEFIRGLDRQSRAAFISRYWYLEDSEKTAKRLGISASALRARLSRLRKKLKKYLTERGVEI